MLTITIIVNAPSWTAQGVKEHLAMCLEQFGDVRVVAVHCTEPTELCPDQLRMKGGP